MKNTPNLATFDAEMKCESVLKEHNKILLSYSGGSDSDTMLDLVQRVIKKMNWQGEIKYVWFDTGIEYQATKDHIPEIEKRYGITIEYASQMISRLQAKDFDFKNDGNKSYEELEKKYPNTQSALKFWCNTYGSVAVKKPSHFNIDQFTYLKEFMIENPPDFKISDHCCKGAKKDTAHDYIKQHTFDLQLLGLRGAEGGVRATNTKGCFTKHSKTDLYRPIWWFTNKDKKEYKDFYELKYSDCYEVYGFNRTGCSCCPFGSKFEEELEIVKQHEPLLYKAVNNIFGKSYEYTRKYREYKRRKKNGILDGQTSLF